METQINPNRDTEPLRATLVVPKVDTTTLTTPLEEHKPTSGHNQDLVVRNLVSSLKPAAQVLSLVLEDLKEDSVDNLDLVVLKQVDSVDNLDLVVLKQVDLAQRECQIILKVLAKNWTYSSEE